MPAVSISTPTFSYFLLSSKEYFLPSSHFQVVSVPKPELGLLKTAYLSSSFPIYLSIPIHLYLYIYTYTYTYTSIPISTHTYREREREREMRLLFVSIQPVYVFLVGAFRPLTLKVVIDLYVLIAVLLAVSGWVLLVFSPPLLFSSLVA